LIEGAPFYKKPNCQTKEYAIDDVCPYSGPPRRSYNDIKGSTFSIPLTIAIGALYVEIIIARM